MKVTYETTKTTRFVLSGKDIAELLQIPADAESVMVTFRVPDESNYSGCHLAIDDEDPITVSFVLRETP